MEVTYVARLTDGLILCESWDSGSALAAFKSEAKQVLKRLGRAVKPEGGRCTIESSHGASQGMCFHYKIANGVVYMTICKKSYNKKLAFIFLEELTEAFHEELKLEYGTHSTDFHSIIETVEKPYQFIRFDRTIQRKKTEFQDPRSGKALQKLNESLSEVSTIMRQNIEDILQRGEDLSSVSRKAGDLKMSCSQFARETKKLQWQALLQKYVPIVVLVSTFILIFYWKFFI